MQADESGGSNADSAREADGAQVPAPQTNSTSADPQKSRRALLRAAVAGSVALTGAGAAAMAPWRPRLFGPIPIAFASVSPTPTAVPHGSPTPPKPTATPTSPPKPTATPTPPPKSITIKGFAFNPATLSVPRGTTITWTNQDSFPHTSTSDTNNVWDSGPIAGNGGSFSFTFDLAPGTYGYHCSIHTFMKGSVTVT